MTAAAPAEKLFARLVPGNPEPRSDSIGTGLEKKGPVTCHGAIVSYSGKVQLTRFQVWPPQNMPPKAQP